MLITFTITWLFIDALQEVKQSGLRDEFMKNCSMKIQHKDLNLVHYSKTQYFSKA